MNDVSAKIAKAVKANLESALAEVAQHRALVVLLVVLGFTALAPDVIVKGADGFHINKGLMFVAAGLILLAFVHRNFFFLLCLLLIPANLIHLHLDHHWGDKQLDARLEAAFESPPREALEYLQAHLDGVDFAIFAFSVLYLVVLLGVVLRGRGRKLPALQKAASLMLIGWLIVLVAGFDLKLNEFPPYRLGARIVHVKDRYELLTSRRDFLAQHPLPAANCTGKYDKVVIVLGESALSDHMSVFGYGKATTPFAVSSKPHAFDALAPSNQTRYALGMMLSDASPGNFPVFYRQHSLVGQLRACGYRTLWISNQGRLGMYDSYTSSMALEAHEQIFLNEWSWTDTKYDEQIVTELGSRGIYRRHNQVTFVHLIGSHTRYDERYPRGFGFADVHGTVAQYDNSLLYTDHVLSELYRKFQDPSLLFIYVSDHGQFVSEKTFGSGFLPGYREEYRVPLLIWTRDTAAVERIRAEVGGSKLNTDSLDSIVKFLLGQTDAPRVSTARNVSVLSPDHVMLYDDLQEFRGE